VINGSRDYSVRRRVAGTLAVAVQRFPYISPDLLDIGGMSPRDARLAVAIYRTALQRWITLEYLLDRSLRRPLHTLEPDLQGVLISAAAQIVFMARLPAYAVVDESVSLARTMVRSGAAGLVNAVLRKLSDQVEILDPDEPWQPSPDRLPTESGSIRLNGVTLPSLDDIEEHLSIATSHPYHLVGHWMASLGQETTTMICLHGIKNPPIIVAVEVDWQRSLPDQFKGIVQPHDRPGFAVWRGAHDELVTFLAGHPIRRVQDPASAMAVGALPGFAPSCCVDFCAGRGTKTRQLALRYPQARVFATDADAQRLAVLRRAFADHPTVTVVGIERIGSVCVSGSVDLLLLDVPCTNSGVLGRRLEARYRLNRTTLKSLVDLQRAIVRRASGLLCSGGHLLYSTCSLETQENQQQAQWVEQQLGAALVSDAFTLPAGEGVTYHDGSYYALLRWP